MKFKLSTFIALLAAIPSVFSQSPENGSNNEHKPPFEYLIGVYPNQDGEINTQLSVGVNYTDSLSTTIGYYNKSYSSLEEKKVDGDDVDEINNLNKIDVAFNILEYTRSISVNPVKIELVPGIAFDFDYTRKNYELNSNWIDDDSGNTYIYFEKEERENYSFMPEAKLDVL